MMLHVEADERCSGFVVIITALVALSTSGADNGCQIERGRGRAG